VPPEAPAEFNPTKSSPRSSNRVRFVLIGGFAAQINGANVVT
jgi:hypothetical protein